MLLLAMLLPTLSLRQSGQLVLCLALPVKPEVVMPLKEDRRKSLLVFKHAVSPASKVSLHDAHIQVTGASETTGGC